MQINKPSSKSCLDEIQIEQSLPNHPLVGRALTCPCGWVGLILELHRWMRKLTGGETAKEAILR